MLKQMSHWLQGTVAGTLLAIEGLGQHARRRGLANSAGTGEQIGVADSIGGNRLLEGLGNVLLADQFVKCLGAVAASNDRVTGTPLRKQQAEFSVSDIPLSADIELRYSLGTGPPHKGTHAYGWLCFHPDQVRMVPIAGAPYQGRTD